VEEAVGGALAAKSFRESDTKGFYESEVIVCSFYCLYMVNFDFNPKTKLIGFWLS